MKSLSDKLIVLTIVFVLLSSVMYRLLERQPQVLIGDNVFTVEVAASKEERAQGLSGRAELAEDRGMLFVFDQEFFHGFWMKGMEFALDIYWINDDLEIVYIERNLSPDTFPQSFVSTSPAKYVLELNAGSFYKYDINLGDKVTLKNI